jgi:SMC interacting uncharacterized protein involved in chromosome segregation
MVEELKRQLQEKEQEYLQLTHDFEEYQETSKAFEQELEQEIETQENQRKALQSENDDLKEELKKLKVIET